MPPNLTRPLICHGDVELLRLPPPSLLLLLLLLLLPVPSPLPPLLLILLLRRCCFLAGTAPILAGAIATLRLCCRGGFHCLATALLAEKVIAGPSRLS